MILCDSSAALSGFVQAQVLILPNINSDNQSQGSVAQEAKCLQCVVDECWALRARSIQVWPFDTIITSGMCIYRMMNYMIGQAM